MYQQEFDKLLKRLTPRATLLCGASEFLIYHYSQMLTKKINSDEKYSFYFDEYNFATIGSLLSQSSLFGANTLIVIKTNKMIGKKELSIMLKAVENNPSNSLIIEFYHNESKSIGDYGRDCKSFESSFTSTALKEQIASVRFFEPSVIEMKGYIKARANELGITLEEQLVGHMLSVHNNNIAMVLKELEKFALYSTDSNRFGIESMGILGDGVASFSVEELNYALMDKKPILAMLQRIYDEGISEIDVISEIERFFYNLFLFFAFIKVHGKMDAKGILGYMPPKHIVERFARYCMVFRESQYADIFDILNQWKYESSKGKSKQNLTNLIKIQAMIR